MAVNKRVIAGFVIAPLVVPVATMIFVLMVDQYATLRWLAVEGFISALFTYAGMGVFGLPAYLLLPKRGLYSLPIAVVVGFIAGAIMWCAFIVLFTLSLGNGWSSAVTAFSGSKIPDGAIFPAGVLGVAVGAVFWLIARPDRT